jgi:hypothetical protein
MTMIVIEDDKASNKRCCTEYTKEAEIPDLVRLLLKNQKETDDTIRSLQKSIAGLREQVQDSRAEHAEDISEVKQILHDLRRNMVLLSHERL